MRLMQLIRRPEFFPYTQEEISNQIKQISLLQKQRAESLRVDDHEEASEADYAIKVSQQTLKFMLDKNKKPNNN